jgi:LPXTG-motif cell wall-anchored protein
MTEDVAFEVLDTGEIQTVQMKNDTAKGKVILNKTDKDSGEPLKDVEFELRDSEGNVLETLKTDAAGHAESSLYEIASYENGTYSEQLKYYLVETKTLDGYQLDSTEHEIVFEYVDDTTPIIEVKMELTNEQAPEGTPENTTVTSVPKTGDSTNLWLPILLMALAAGTASGIFFARNRKKKEEK